MTAILILIKFFIFFYFSVWLLMLTDRFPKYGLFSRMFIKAFQQFPGARWLIQSFSRRGKMSPKTYESGSKFVKQIFGFNSKQSFVSFGNFFKKVSKFSEFTVSSHYNNFNQRTPQNSASPSIKLFSKMYGMNNDFIEKLSPIDSIDQTVQYYDFENVVEVIQKCKELIDWHLIDFKKDRKLTTKLKAFYFCHSSTHVISILNFYKLSKAFSFCYLILKNAYSLSQNSLHSSSNLVSVYIFSWNFDYQILKLIFETWEEAKTNIWKAITSFISSLAMLIFLEVGDIFSFTYSYRRKVRYAVLASFFILPTIVSMCQQSAFAFSYKFFFKSSLSSFFPFFIFSNNKIINQHNMIIPLLIVLSICILILIIFAKPSRRKKVPSSILMEEQKFSHQKFNANILQLKEKIDPQNMQKEHLKDIVYLQTQYFDLKALQMAELFQKKRRTQFPTSQRQKNFQAYLQTILNECYQIEEIEKNMRKELIAKLGLYQGFLLQFSVEVEKIRAQITQNKTKGNYLGISFRPMTLQEVKKIYQLEIRVLKEQSQELLKNIGSTIQNWPVHKKKYLMSLFSSCVNDLIIDLVPGLSAERYEANKGTYKNELTKEANHFMVAFEPVYKEIYEYLNQLQSEMWQ